MNKKAKVLKTEDDLAYSFIKRKRAVLQLEDGRRFNGYSFGHAGETIGEVVFNTALAGYQEVLTDPSYQGQIVCMTYPHIGNYGINDDDNESRRPFLKGYIAKEFSRATSNWRATHSLEDYLKKHKIIGLEGIDTRALTKHIRSSGSMKGVISSKTLDAKALSKKLAAAPSMEGSDLVKDVTHGYELSLEEALLSGMPLRYDLLDALDDKKNITKLLHEIDRNIDKLNQVKIPKVKFSVAAFDFGIKLNILRNLRDIGCDVTVVPSTTTALEILAGGYDGVFLSNGPGDPAAVDYAVENIKGLLGKIPIFGICLGHQLLSLAFGAKTYKLKFGHHGVNQPVKNLRTGKVEITSQNHGFAVSEASLKRLNKKSPWSPIEVSHINLNDRTIEGIRSEKARAFSVQYHPEAAPGPLDAKYLFDEFAMLMTSNTARKEPAAKKKIKNGSSKRLLQSSKKRSKKESK